MSSRRRSSSRVRPVNGRRPIAAAARARAGALRGAIRRVVGLSLLVALAPAMSATAQLAVGAGATLTSNGTDIHVDCLDLVVDGTLALDAGATLSLVRDVTLLPGAAFSSGAGAIEVAGDWARSGGSVFVPDAVRMVDGCGLGSRRLLGSTTFQSLAVESASGGRVELEPGGTIAVEGSLRLAGAPGLPLVLRGTTPGTAASLALSPNISSIEVSAIDVDDVAVTPDVVVDADSTVGGNAMGWIVAFPTPAVSGVVLPLMVGSLIAFAIRAQRSVRPVPRRAPYAHTTRSNERKPS